MYEHWTRRRVEWADTDSAGIIHFSRYLVYMETAEHELRRAAGSSVSVEVAGGKVSWPRLSTACEFVRPVKFEDELDIHIFILHKGTRSLTFGCEFFHHDELVARGQMSSACCMLEPHKPLKSIPIPAAIADLLQQVPSEVRQAWQSPIRPLSS